MKFMQFIRPITYILLVFSVFLAIDYDFYIAMTVFFPLYYLLNMFIENKLELDYELLKEKYNLATEIKPYDYVRIRADLVVNEMYGGCNFYNFMEKLKGKNLLVTSITSNNYYAVHLDGNGNGLEDAIYITKEMIAVVKKEIYI